MIKKKVIASLSAVALLSGSFAGEIIKANELNDNVVENKTNSEVVDIDSLVEMENGVGEVVESADTVKKENSAKTVTEDVEKEEGSSFVLANVSFKDVTKQSYAYEAIMYLAKEGIVAGYGNGYFGIKDNVTRGQVSALISRYKKLDTGKGFKNPYTDVKGNMFEKEILAVTNAGYMGGKGNGKFDPNATLTRAEMAVVLTNVFNLKVKATYDFHDMNEGHWANNAVRALYSNGITFGSGDNKYNPNGKVTREQYAEFLYRGIHLDENFVADPIPDKPKGDKPAYTNAQGNMTRAGLARLIVESVDPNIKASTVSFSDVDKGSYTEEYIQKAVALGFIDPKNYNTGFSVNKAVDRAEVSTWMVNAMAKNNAEYAKAIKELQSDLTLLPVTEYLKGGIAKKDVPYVGIALGTGLFNGYSDHSFRPKGTITKDGTATIISRYKNILTKNPKSFSDLNEFREVATTGTNILTVTPYIKHPNTNKGFEDVLGKPITMHNRTGVTTIERVIVVDTATKNIKGAYKNMFIGKEDEKYTGRGVYDFYMEFTFIPSRDITPMQWADGSIVYTSGGTANYDKGVAFGYKTPSRYNGDNTVPGQFLKTGKKNQFWMTNGAWGNNVSVNTDDGSRCTYILSEK